ncbi:chemotaxis protein CheA [Halobellus rarus]|uniref:Chemotaxis protein CheA n=1 Tax=Halobellus rarus TaxID=1126237 RepID=A0ABD6CQU0_9EURY|nr:chemotaxis protein CheA [Halobellus rarus]
MDDELYQEFITESEESITQLNNSLLDLESNPDDTEAIDDIFRQAHTLKGNFGAMGFDNAAKVAHAVEDLLDAVRNGEIEVTHERMDLVFDGMDEILDILHEIESDGESQRDPSGLVDDIRAAAAPDSDSRADSDDGDRAADAGSETAAEAESESAADEACDLAADVLDLDDPEVAEADHLYHARIELDAGDMKGVDAGLFVGGLPDDLAVVGARPDLEEIEEGEFDEDFVVFVADVPELELEPLLEDLWKVESVTLTDVSSLVGGEPATGSATSEGEPASGGSSSTESPADIGEAASSDSPETEAAASAGSPSPSEDSGVADSEAVTGDVDTDSAAAAVDAVVDAYTSGGSSTGDIDESGAEGDGDDAGESGSEAAAGGGSETAATERGSGEDGAEADPDVDGGSGESDEGGDDGRGEPGNASDDRTDRSDSGAGDGGDGSGGDSGTDDADGEETPSIQEVKSVRVDVDQLDELHSLVEQLVTSRIKLRQAVGEDETAGRDTLDELDKISSNLQDTVMDMRLIPLKKVFDKFPRLVRDLAREEEKRVSFSVEGQDIELDRTILDEISDPLMHVLRNAVDHGIETPEEREAAGKSKTGSVELRAEREHDTVVITVEDDGAGIDADVIREKASEKGIRPREELAELPDEEIYEYIFHPGFSTNEEITDVSGRGVGMDVVKTTVESLDGSVNVDSTLGAGTEISIRLPVSVAIIKVLFVQIGDREFGVPIKYIDEISQQTRIQRVDGAEVVVHEEKIFPLIRLREALELGSRRADSGMIVRVRPADRQVALRCDGVARQEEVVVTPLQGPLRGTEGLSGTAVVGDGNVVPILDVNSLPIPDEGKQARRQWAPPEDDGAEAEGAAD